MGRLTAEARSREKARSRDRQSGTSEAGCRKNNSSERREVKEITYVDFPRSRESGRGTFDVRARKRRDSESLRRSVCGRNCGLRTPDKGEKESLDSSGHRGKEDPGSATVLTEGLVGATILRLLALYPGHFRLRNLLLTPSYALLRAPFGNPLLILIHEPPKTTIS